MLRFDMPFIAAQANRDHAQHFYELAQMASDDLFTHLFGERARAVLQAMFLREDNEFSHRHTRFLLADGEIAGMLHGFPSGEAQAHGGRSLWLMLRHAQLQVMRFFIAAVILRDILGFIGEGLDPDDYYISMLAIYPRYRGRSYSKSLLAEAERLAAQRNCLRLALDVDERNAVARVAYRRAGFEQIGESKEVNIEDERLRMLRLAKPVAGRD